ncbi:MAG TPA: hypothetical protein VM940_04485 [Chthoniobacterales bacterium]|jgi:hypothetical protein|nr:hypothetical protein [Chthoniobacterales bacterium]
MRTARTFCSVSLALNLFALFAGTGCTKNVEDAVVMEKEYIAPAEPSPTPPPAAPNASETPQSEATPSPGPVQTDLAPDEVAVDSYVMKKDVRGTGKDPRAQTREQWLIKVELARDGSRFTVRTDRAHFLKFKPGDRIRVSYKQGNYTGTVWSASIED